MQDVVYALVIYRYSIKIYTGIYRYIFYNKGIIIYMIYIVYVFVNSSTTTTKIFDSLQT